MQNARSILVLELQSLAKLCLKEAQSLAENGGVVATYDLKQQISRIESLNDDLETQAEQNASILGVG